jgi:hypothetical protein
VQAAADSLYYRLGQPPRAPVPPPLARQALQPWLQQLRCQPRAAAWTRAAHARTCANTHVRTYFNAHKHTHTNKHTNTQEQGGLSREQVALGVSASLSHSPSHSHSISISLPLPLPLPLPLSLSLSLSHFLSHSLVAVGGMCGHVYARAIVCVYTCKCTCVGHSVRVKARN